MDDHILRKLTTNITLIRIVFGALLFGIVSFLTAMSIIIPAGSNQELEPNGIFQLVAPILMVIAVSVSIFLRRAMLAKVHNETNPLNLIKTYTSTRIIQLGILDASILFAIVCYVLTTNTYFILLSGLGICYFTSLFPLQKKVAQQLKLDNPVEN